MLTGQGEYAYNQVQRFYQFPHFTFLYSDKLILAIISMITQLFAPRASGLPAADQVFSAEKRFGSVF